MDRLPKHNELVFERLRKTLYLRLTTVIRSLGTKFLNPIDREVIQYCADRLHTVIDCTIHGSKSVQPVWCLYLEIRNVIWFYQRFIRSKSGDRRRTKKLEAGIARLEWLRDNWDDLEVTGDLKRGYELGVGQ